MALTAKMSALLKKTKANLILEHDADDELLLGYISAAVAYAEDYQHKPEGYYSKRGSCMRDSTTQAVVMLASHFYESRDGSTGGFFADNVQAASQVWKSVNDLLRLNREAVF
jgi:hypothetical protein